MKRSKTTVPEMRPARARNAEAKEARRAELLVLELPKPPHRIAPEDVGLLHRYASVSWHLRNMEHKVADVRRIHAELLQDLEYRGIVPREGE